MTRDTNPMKGHCRFADIIHGEIMKHFGNPVKVIELGCGSGLNLSKFTSSVARVGIEPHPENYEKAKKLSKDATIINSDHNYLQRFSINQFDVGYTCSVLDHMENFIPALSDLCRVSKRVMLFEPVITGASRQALPSETSCWKISWYHDIEAWLKDQKGLTFTVTPKILYRTSSGLKFHQFIINSEGYAGGKLYSEMFESHKGKATNSKLSICEAHRQIYDLLVLNLQDRPILLGKLIPLLEVVFAQGISVVHKLIEYKLSSRAKMKENIPPISEESRKLREERIRLVALEKELREIKESIGKKADYA